MEVLVLKSTQNMLKIFVFLILWWAFPKLLKIPALTRFLELIIIWFFFFFTLRPSLNTLTALEMKVPQVIEFESLDTASKANSKYAKWWPQESQAEEMIEQCLGCKFQYFSKWKKPSSPKVEKSAPDRQANWMRWHQFQLIFSSVL